MIDDSFFSLIDSEERAYILGILMADGNVSKTENRMTISLHQKDLDILEKIKEALKFTGPIRQYKTYRIISFTSDQIKKDLISLGCVPNKTYLLKCPSIRDDLFRHFIRGYFDGDGTVGLYYRKGKRSKTASLEVKSGFISSKEFTEVAASKVSLMSGATYHFELRKNLGSGNGIMSVNGVNNARKFLDWMYRDANIYMQRKYGKYLQVLYAIHNRVKYAGLIGVNKGSPFEGKLHSDEARAKMRESRKQQSSSYCYRAVRQYALDGAYIREFPSIKQAANFVGGESSKIIEVCRGKRQTTKGFLWKHSQTDEEFAKAKQAKKDRAAVGREDLMRRVRATLSKISSLGESVEAK